MASHYGLPLLDVCISHAGTGLTRYSRWFGLPECEVWTVVTFAGQAAEDDAFLDHRAADAGDRRAINTAIEHLGLDWGIRRLATLRFESQILVQRLRPRIRVVAGALIEHGSLTAAQIERIR